MSCVLLRGRLVASSILVAALQAGEVPTTITVTAQPEASSGVQAWSPGPPVSDVAGWLRGQPGVRAVRMGSHGLDPVVDGQGAARLRVTIDGCPVQGGCPNRMDPPSSYAPVGAFDIVELDRGRGDVRSAGGSAGHLRVERHVPVFSAEDRLQGRVGGSVASQGHERQTWADVSAGGASGGVRAIAGASAAGSYENGRGQEILSGYRQVHGTLLGAWRPVVGQEYQAGGSMVQARDVRFAGASMDAPVSDMVLATAGTSHRLGEWTATSRAFVSQVDHEMDNYSLRPWSAAMAMRTVTSADVLGGRLDIVRTEGAVRPAFGFDLEVQHIDARRTRAANPTATTFLESVVWPDVQLARFGAYGEIEGRSGAWRSVLGLRLDHIASSAAARDATLTMGRLAPRTLYQTYYGVSGDERSEWLPGAVLRCERAIGTTGLLGVTLGRTMRAADVSERYIAINGMGTTPAAVAASRWVGNPDIAAEAHHQMRFTADWREEGSYKLSTTAFADRVQDHILRDRARGEDGVLTSDGATIYHNTEALYAGGGVSGDWRSLSSLSLAASADYVWAKDLASGLPLAQIPPLSGSATLRGHLFDDRLVPALSVRWAVRQGRVDADPASGSGIDPGKTPGWAVVDVRVTWLESAWGEAAIGCDNLFDRTYADHLAKAETFDPTVTRVDEPGRSLWASLDWRF
jgi:iron complex outermembrane receptor protein